MRILLVNPYIYDFTAYDLWLKPLGLLYIASVLKKYTDAELVWLDVLDRFQEGAFPEGGKTVRKGKPDGRGKFYREVVESPPIYRDTSCDYARYGMPMESFEKKMSQLPEVDIILVTSLMTYWIDGLAVTVDALAKRFPAAKIVVGGILPTLVPLEQLKQQVRAHYFIRGYGERRILEFVEAQGVHVRPYPDFTDIDTIPWPAVEYLGSRDHLPLLTSRGCPFHCTYCASDLLNPAFAQRSAEKIIEEITVFHKQYGTRDFTIFDDALLVNKKNRFLKVFREIAGKLGGAVHFHTPNGLHVGEIDQEVAETFYSCGFKMLRLSLESTRAEVLDKSSGKVTIEQMEQGVANLTAAGYNPEDIGVYLLFGLPGQRVEDLEVSLRFVKGLGVTPHLSFYSPVPGTADFEQLQRSGVLSEPLNLYETNKHYFLYNKSDLSHEDIRHIQELTARLQD